MIEIRSFLNTDPPAIVDIWQQQKPLRCLSQVMNRQLLDRMVLAKPYFDPAGLLVAFDNGKPVGFVHAGFCPNQEHSCVDYSRGVISQLQVSNCDSSDEVASSLLESALAYLKSRGAKSCFAGGAFPDAPFYVGLYGGSRIPGVPEEDAELFERLSRIGFQSCEQIHVMQLNLVGFRPAVNRALMTVRRQYQVAAIVDPLLPNWWECCTYGWAEVFGFRVIRRSDKQVVGSVLFWEIQPLSSQWGKVTMGLVDLAIEENARKQGIGTFLINESLRHLADSGVACVEIQLRGSDEPAIAIARKTGFEQISQGREMRLELA